MSNALEGLKWRYACKKFNPEKKVSEADLKIIAESLRLTASSYGLQLWHFYLSLTTNLEKKCYLTAGDKNKSSTVHTSSLWQEKRLR